MSDTAAAEPQKREEAVKVLGEILGHMELPAKLEAKDGADGAISIAVQIDEALPGVTAGRRSPFSDALQYLVNKRVNRPGAERRQVLVGIGSHPEPRGPKAARGAAPVAGGAPAPGAAPIAAPQSAASAPAPRPAPQARPPRAAPAPAAAAPSAREADERSLPVEVPPSFAAEVRRMAEASAKLGRYYVLLGMGAEDRARVVKAAADTRGVTLQVDGDGRNRRVVFSPEKPVPLPRKLLPLDDFDDEEVE